MYISTVATAHDGLLTNERSVTDESNNVDAGNNVIYVLMFYYDH